MEIVVSMIIIILLIVISCFDLVWLVFSLWLSIGLIMFDVMVEDND